MHDENFETIVKHGGIHCTDNTQKGRRWFAKLDMVTRDAQQAISGADVVFVLTQTLQHEQLAARIGPLLEDGQLVIVVPGYMGSVYFRRAAPSNRVLIAEGESTAIDARIIDNGVVNILFRNVRNALSFIPASQAQAGLAIASQLFDTYGYTRKNVVESALHNPNIIVHTIGAIMSASRIEHSQGEFWMYKESFTPSIWNTIRILDEEKNLILERFGCERLDYIDACKFRNEEDLSKDSSAVFQSYTNSGPKGPLTVRSRYIYEDVPMGLCLMSSLGRRCGIATPLCDALITIAGSLLGEDFWSQGRTLRQLGYGGMSLDAIRDAVAS